MNAKKTIKQKSDQIPASPAVPAAPDRAPDTDPPIDWQGLTEISDPDNPVVESERVGESLHSPQPDARDEAKVERLAAPDWHIDQPLPSAKNAIDPRGENTPDELFEPPEQKRPRE